MEFCCAWYWYNPRPLCENPGQGNLCRGCIFSFSKLIDKIKQCLVCCSRLFCESRNDIADITLGKFCVLIHFAREKTFSQWAICDKANSQFFNSRNYFFLMLPCPKRILTLQRTHWLYCMRALNGFRTSFRKAKVFHFTFFDQFFYGSCNIFNWYIWIDAVLVQQINDISL